MATLLSRLKQAPKGTAMIGGGLLLAVALAYAIAEYRLLALQDTLKEQINEQEAAMLEIASTIGVNGVDDATESVVADCVATERTSFDVLLGRLDSGLSTPELTELERLFGRCGSFYAERKAVMASKLLREVEVYEHSVEQLQTLQTFSATKKYHVETWKELSKLEEKQAELSMELVRLQDRIIRTLLEGKSAQSDEIKSILAEVGKAQETLIATNKQTAEMREVLSTP